MIKILYVEDNPTQRELMTRLLELEMEDYEIRFARNGSEGLDMAKEWRPDVILMDLRMPGMNGFEAIEQIRAFSPTAQTPIIAISAWANVKNEQRALALGANKCIVKPFDLDELVDAIDACLNESC
jgi:CheY-like chemotaxis protein